MTLANDNTGSFGTGGLGDVGEIIRGAWWGTTTDNTATVTLTGLTIGDIYEVQIFVNDARNGRDQDFIATLDNGNGGVGIDLKLSNRPSGGSAGDYGIGTFTADATTQSLNMSGFLDGAESPGRIQVNAIQLRKLGTTVELLPGSHPLINEFSASNAGVIDDDNGNSSDWIEIYNAGEDAIDLAGYSLTDDPTDATKYVLPSTILSGGQFLIVFASDDADPTTGSDLYTGFALSSAGEYLGFFDPVGGLISEYGPNGSDYPAQYTDTSYGLIADGNFDTPSFFATPTPGFGNDNPVDGVIDELPTVSVERGFYELAFDVDIASQLAGASVVYTTDGSAPSLSNGTRMDPADSNSTVAFTLDISTTTSLRTAIVKDGFATRGATTHTYIFLGDVITSNVLDTTITSQYTDEFLKEALLDIPTLSFSYDTEITDSFVPEQAASIEWLPPDGSEGFQVDAGISAFGGYHSSSQWFEKKNFRVEFRSQYGASQLEFPLYEGFDNGITPTESFDSLEFRAGSHDRFTTGAGMSPRFVDDTLLEAGHVAPHGRFVHIYINGVYWGQYHMRERWDADFLSQYYGGEEDDYEATNGNHTAGDNIELNGGIATPGNWSPGEAYDGEGLAWENIKILADTAGDATLEGPTGGYQELREVVNLEQYLDFMLIYMAGASENEYRAGGSVDGSVPYSFYHNDPDRWLRTASDRTGNAGAGNILGTLVAEADPEFLTLYADRIQHLFGEGGVLSEERSAERLQARLDETAKSFILESARYSATGETKTPAEFAAAMNTVFTAVLPSIPGSMISNLRARGLFPLFDAPTFAINGSFQNGGAIESGDVLTLDATETIYYTTDGTDPRLEGGGINPKAVAYDPSITTSTVFSYGADWKYLDNGSNQGTAWQSPAFDDSSWVVGASELGYGDDPASTISYGNDPNNKHTTTYFRKTFEVTENFHSATLDLFYDDGAVVYLNGQEIGRPNMGGNIGDPVDWQAFALNSVGDGITAVLDATSSLLVGTNTLAVEVHQGTAGSSDLSFNAGLTLTSQVGETEAIPLATTTNIQARAFRNGQWSAVRDATFVIPILEYAPQSHLRITELHYNPLDPTTSELLALPGIDNNSFEFVELMNVGTYPIDLDGVDFTNGITFDFSGSDVSTLAPGETVLVVSDRAAFELRHGAGKNIAGEYDGGFSGSGEPIELVDRDGQMIVAFTYSDDSPWPQAPDGGGPSLEAVDPLGDCTQASNWRASTADEGSPGAAVAPLHGDYDRNGLVDSQDYVLWARQYGSTVAVAGVGADGNVDGIVNASDYTVWRDNLGAVLPLMQTMAFSSAAEEEPSDIANEPESSMRLTYVPSARRSLGVVRTDTLIAASTISGPSVASQQTELLLDADRSNRLKAVAFAKSTEVRHDTSYSHDEDADDDMSNQQVDEAFEQLLDDVF